MANDADIGIRVFLDDAASAGLNAINSNLGRMGTMAMRASNGFHNMSAANMATMGVLLGSGAAMMMFGAAIKFSVDQASNLQQSMFSVAVATHVPMDVAMQYTGVLMNMAASSTYSTQEIADGIVQMGRAGYSIHDIFTQMSQAGAGFVNVGGKMVPIMSSMVQAGIALGIATRSTAVQGFTLLTQAMVAYQAPADQALHYANLLQFGFEHQRGSVADFTAALSQVLPEASRFHVSLKEVIASLDTFGPAMASSARAGTALRYMMDGLYSPTKGAKEEMKALGLASFDASGNFHSAFYNAKGDPIDFAQAVQLLHNKLKGMNQEAQNDALHKLFSVRGGQGASDLLQMIGRLQGYLNTLSKSSDNSGGAMKRWDEVMKTTAGAMAGLKSSFQDLGAVIGMAILPIVTTVATKLNQFVSYIRNMTNANPQAAASFLGLGTAMSGVGIVAGIILMAVTGVGSGLLIIVGIVLGVIAAVVALTAGIMIAANWFRQFIATSNPVAVVLRALGATIMSLAAQVGGAFVSAWRQVQTAFSALRPWIPQITQALQVLGAIIGGVLLAAILIIIGVIVGLARAFAMLVVGVAQVLAGLTLIVTGIVNVFIAMFHLIVGVFTNNKKMMEQGWSELGKSLLMIIQGALMAILGVFTGVFGAILGFVIGFVGSIISFFQHLASVLVGHSIIPDMMNAIRNVIVNVFNAVAAFIASIIARIISFFVQMGANIVSAVTAAWNFIRNAFNAGVNAAVMLVLSLVTRVVAYIINLRSQMISNIQSAWNSFHSAVANGVNNAVSLVSTLPGRIGSIISGLASSLFSWGANAMQQFANGLGSTLGAVVSQVQNAAGQVANFLAHHSPAKMGPLSDDDKWMPNMMRMFALDIERHIPLVTSAASRAAGGIASAPSTARLTAPVYNPLSSLVGGGGGNTTVPLIVDGQVLASVVINRFTGQMQNNGFGRSFR